MSLTIYFDKLPDESSGVQELLDRIAVDPSRPIAVDLGRSSHPVLYCREIRHDQSGNAVGIVLTDQPLAEPRKKTR
jgi:hypothetical protein